MTEAEKLKHCQGCRDDFYNDKNPIGVKRCWSLPSMEIVTRYRIGTWTQPDSPRAFAKVSVPKCFHQDGQHFYKELPRFVKMEDVA